MRYSEICLQKLGEEGQAAAAVRQYDLGDCDFSLCLLFFCTLQTFMKGMRTSPFPFVTSEVFYTLGYFNILLMLKARRKARSLYLGLDLEKLLLHYRTSEKHPIYNKAVRLTRTTDSQMTT